MNKRKKIMFVFGTRPEAIKMAPVIKEAEKHKALLDLRVVVTGQHRHMLDQVLRIFDVKPDYDLDIMKENQTLVDIINKASKGLEGVLLKEKPDMLLVQGDTSTAFISALMAYYHKIPVGHVEAGLRTFDKWLPFPEEMNRRLISSVADLHFAPTQTSVNNLLAEKVAKEGVFLTGNTVIDALLQVAGREFNLGKIGLKLDEGKKIILVTMHRRETFGEKQKSMCLGLAKLAKKYKNEIAIVLPVHKNPKVKNVVFEILAKIDNVKLIEPLDYEPFVHLMKASYLLITDSGGVQEEGPSLGKPVLVMREKTERPEAIFAGTVRLVGVDEEAIFYEASKLISGEQEYQKMSKAVNPYGDGQAAERIIQAILHWSFA